MSDTNQEELTELQEWVLKTLYESIMPQIPNRLLFYQAVCRHFKNETEAAISNAICDLERRGYIWQCAPEIIPEAIRLAEMSLEVVEKKRSPEELRRAYKDLLRRRDKISFVILRDKGKEKAKKLFG